MTVSALNRGVFAPLNASEVDLFQDCKKIGASPFFIPSSVKFDAKKVQPTNLSHVLRHFFQEIIEGNLSFDPLVALERLSHIIPLDILQTVLHKDPEAILRESKSRELEAKIYLKITEHIPVDPRLSVQGFLDAIKILVDTLIMGLGVRELFDPLIHESFKFQKIMVILTLFTVLGAAVGSSLMTEILLSIAVMSLIWPQVKPIPTHLPPNAECLTRRGQNNALCTHARKESLDEIAAILKMNRHAILVGPSRVGKSLTAKAFADAVQRGDYPELKGMVVFRLNTADLIDHYSFFTGGAGKILSEISAALGRHRHRIILVLDEIHMACKNKQKMADQLKPFLDEGGGFPHVIGITTEEEYQKHVQENYAFSLRFDRVDIRDTQEEETLMILAENVLKSRYKPFLGKENILKYIFERSSKDIPLPQPAAALKLLQHCIHKTGRTQKLPAQKKLAELSSRQSFLAFSTLMQAQENSEEGEQIANQIDYFQKKWMEEKREAQSFYQAKDLRDLATRKMYGTLIKISQWSQKELSGACRQQMSLYLLLQELLENFLEPYLQDTSKHLGMKVSLDKALVDEVLSEIQSSSDIQPL